MNDLKENLRLLEQALVKRDPLFADHLKPGRRRALVLKKLESLKQGSPSILDSIADVFEWHDGIKPVISASTVPGSQGFEVSYEAVSLDPAELVIFNVFEQAFIGFKSWKYYIDRRPNLRPAINRYLPLASGIRGCWEFVVDIVSGSVIFVSSHSENPFLPAYDSLNHFVAALVESNECQESLSFFQRAKELYPECFEDNQASEERYLKSIGVTREGFEKFKQDYIAAFKKLSEDGS